MNPHWSDILTPIVRGRRWLIAFDVMAAATPLAARLHRMGAARSFAVATSTGMGPLPDPAHTETLVVPAPPTEGLMDALRASGRVLADLPQDARQTIEGWDPARTARVISTIFSDGAPVAARAQLGRRPRSWQQLEDKTVIDAVWDAAGVERAPSTLVPAGDLRAAVRELAGPRGVVVTADNRDGFHGGAELTRSVASAAEITAAEAFFSARADTVRVMPFLDGVPCGIAGMVFPDRTAVFRPMEMLVLRRGDGRFLYAGTAGWWNPDPEGAASIREVARRVGEHLRRTVDYRGAFTVDGVFTDAGFLPTELNPRVGGSMPHLFHQVDVDVNLLNRAVVEGLDLDWRATLLEDEVMSSTETRRAGRAGIQIDAEPDASEVHVRFTPTGCLLASAAESEAVLSVGPGVTKSFLSIRLNPEKTPLGPSTAGRVAAALRRADALWDLQIGPVEPSIP